MKFTDCIEIVGAKPAQYKGTKQYVSTGAVEEYFINKNSIEEYTYNERPSRADLVGKSGDILFAKMAETKKTLILNRETENYLFSTGFFVIRPKNGIITTKCLYYLLNSKNFLSQKEKNSSGTTQKAITNTGLEKINVNVPLFSKQEQIVKQFDLLTNIIKNYQRQLEKYDLLIKSRFIEMFGDPVSNPMGWNKIELGKACKEVRYGTSKPAIENGKYTYLRMNNITYEGELDLTNIKTIDISDDELAKCSVKKGDILFNRTNSIDLCGKTCLFKLHETMVIAGYIIRVRVNEKLNPQYVVTFFNTKSIKKMLREMAKGAVNQANINAQEMQAIKIPLPPIEQQNTFAAFVQQIDKSKFAVQKSLEKAETLYKSLMQRYFA